ncbi:MAG: glutamate racemase [Pseudomonadota bacterium]
MDPKSPILLFDTGVGGLTVHAALRELLPDAPVIYAADYAGLPYGEKTEAEVAARVAGLLGRMAERWHPRLVCIACNTASTIALGMVREVLEIPIVGTVPAIKPAASVTTCETFALIGTNATIRQTYVDDLEAQFANGKRLIRIAAPELVDLAEAKLRGEPIETGAIKAIAAQLREKSEGEPIDCLVLACTHFPLLADEFSQVFGADIKLIDGAEGIARRIAHLNKEQDFNRKGHDRFVTTGSLGRTHGLAKALGKRGFGAIESFASSEKD